MKISVIIPCYNEANTINKILGKINKLKNTFNFEIIVIDDNSKDGTIQILQNDCKDYYSNLLINEKNYGKGYSVRKGINASTGDIILIQDADLEYDPNDYAKLINPLINYNADVVYGTRFYGTPVRKVHFFWHTMANKMLTFICNLRTNLNLTDMECGFKVFKKEFLKNLELKENRFGFEPEITIKLAQKKASFYEVGISYYGRPYIEGKKISFKDALRALYVIIFCYF